LADALEAEVQSLLDQHRDERHDGRQAVTRNGYLPAREVETGVGSIPVQVPKFGTNRGKASSSTPVWCHLISNAVAI